MDLVRKILIAVEDTDADTLWKRPLEIDGYDAATVAHHAEIMQEAVLVDAHIIRGAGEAADGGEGLRLTWAGIPLAVLRRTSRGPFVTHMYAVSCY
jgi:hypothetical protein